MNWARVCSIQTQADVDLKASCTLLGWGRGNVNPVEPLPIASIFFRDDFRLQVLQALSIDRLIPTEEISRYIVVVNDPDEDTLAVKFRLFANRWLSPTLARKLEILTSAAVIGSYDRDDYYDQQAIKLSIAGRISEPHWLMLDAKNHLVHPATMGLFFRDSKLLMNVENTGSYWSRYLRKSLDAVDETAQELPERHLSSVTPIMMRTESVLELTAYLENRYSCGLPTALRKTGGTEFLLYYAWILKNGQMENFKVDDPPFKTLFTSWPQESKDIISFIASTGEDRPFLGVHRKRIRELEEGQVRELERKWREHLLAAWEDHRWFLTDLTVAH